MAKNLVPIDLNSDLRHETDGSNTLVVEISGLPTFETAMMVSEWVRQAVRDNSQMLRESDAAKRH
jgi:hypothetical protein